MTQLFLTVTGAAASVKKTGVLTTGMVGAVVNCSFDASWDGLNRLAVFRCGDVIRDNELKAGKTLVPGEVLTQPGQMLYVGVEGRSKQGDVVIPTVWAEAGVILAGAQASNDPALAPTPSQYERFMAEVEQVDEKIKAALQDVNISAAGAFTIVVTDMQADKTNAEIYEAYLAAKPAYMLLEAGNEAYLLQPISVLPDAAWFGLTFNATAIMVRILNNIVSVEYQPLARAEDIPGDEHINGLIDAKLGVIEHGTY